MTHFGEQARTMQENTGDRGGQYRLTSGFRRQTLFLTGLRLVPQQENPTRSRLQREWKYNL